MNRCKKTAALWLAILYMGLTACTEHEPVPRPEVKLNQNPIDKYEVTIRIEDKVPPPRGLAGKVSYQIENEEQCMPVDYTLAIGGVRLAGYHEQPVVYDRVSDHVFRTYIYEDAVLNENYYGLEICNWGIAVLAADIVFGPSFRNKTLIGRDEIKTELNVMYCPDSRHKNLKHGIGCKSINRFDQFDDETKKRFYQIEILSKRMTP